VESLAYWGLEVCAWLRMSVEVIVFMPTTSGFGEGVVVVVVVVEFSVDFLVGLLVRILMYVRT